VRGCSALTFSSSRTPSRSRSRDAIWKG
jgi:hypothetical protein